MTTAEWALIYARRGWSVVPMHALGSGGSCTCGRSDCPSPAKHPRVRWEVAMSRRADEEEVRAWWRRWPDANVGVVTGTVSGVVTIDIDPRNQGDRTLTDLESDGTGLPPTLESETGGGGRHLWYELGDLELPCVELGPGVELKAERGLIVAPPSRHASGGTYRWIDYSIDPSPLPRWVAQLAESSHSAGAQGHTAPPRTASEQAEFREAWARVGIELEAGDAYYLCPFHDDHHPSLHIDADGCRWYCFACRMGGGTGRLLRKLGVDHPPPPRSRLEGWIGDQREVLICGDTEVEVVGESFHQDELLALTGGQRRFGGVDLHAVAELVPVEGDGIEVQIENRTVGCLSTDDAARFATLIASSIDQNGHATVRASIRGGWDRGRDDVGLFGVSLFLPEPENQGSLAQLGTADESFNLL